MRQRRLFDGLAIGASALCLVHCLLLPLLLLLVPTLALFLAVPESFHLAVFGFAVPTSLVALWAGYRQHGRVEPVAFALAGLALLAMGLFAAPIEAAETALTVLGSILLSLGHLRNWRGLGTGHQADR